MPEDLLIHIDLRYSIFGLSSVGVTYVINLLSNFGESTKKKNGIQLGQHEQEDLLTRLQHPFISNRGYEEGWYGP